MLKRFLIILGVVAIMGFTMGCEPPENMKEGQNPPQKQRQQEQQQLQQKQSYDQYDQDEDEGGFD